ncbi:restriction endonuclease [Mailhella sp.]
MKLKFKQQSFQEEAARAVVDVFAGQGQNGGLEYVRDSQRSILSGWGNAPLGLHMTSEKLRENLHAVQKRNGLPCSTGVVDPQNMNLTIEMETGTGKTYTYIKTMYELNKHYGWSKFIVVVPSVAIREGVAKSFAVMEEHFAEEYGKKIRHFIYDSGNLEAVKNFASDNSIHVMVINSQAFNAKDAGRLIDKEHEKFNWRKPIDVISENRPILIIDEPQSVEGPQTKKRLEIFKAFLTLRYSATHKEDSLYDMVYRLDALDAYNQKLVKKIYVKGITASNEGGNNGYVYLAGIKLSKGAPKASIGYDCKKENSIGKKLSLLSEGDNLYELSGHLEAYKDGFRIKSILGTENSVEFVNGIKLYHGDVHGEASEDARAEIQIRETIRSHFERERALFDMGIKVLSLFFIDKVAKYRQYDAAGQASRGLYAQHFERIYNEELEGWKKELEADSSYARYLEAIKAENTHAGYFSVDKKGRMIDSKLKDKKERTSEDVDAYDLIMKNKELLLDRDPVRSPVRFLFSHSALREGWDNPNVFQICTLKKSASNVLRRQEVGRGMRLCVNQYGERMDENSLHVDVHSVNKLTVIASESYEDFARGLQSELAESIKGRPIAVTPKLFEGRTITSSDGKKWKMNDTTAFQICMQVVNNSWAVMQADNYELTEKYYEDRKIGKVIFQDHFETYSDSICEILDTVYNGNALKPENARDENVEVKLDKAKRDSAEFKELWELISPKTVYSVDFDTEKLVENAVAYINEKLNITGMYFTVERGSLEEIKSREDLQAGKAFTQGKSEKALPQAISPCKLKYDLIGKIVDDTGLTRKTVVEILTRISPDKFAMFKKNSEEFLQSVASLINEKLADAIVEKIVYTKLGTNYELADVFPIGTPQKGKLGKNTMPTAHHLYDHLIYDSDIERKMCEELERHSDMVVVYAKLPKKFSIATPVTKKGYSPDWAIAFKKGMVKHVYVVAETKGSTKDADLRGVEKAKITCAKKHFEAISGTDTVFHQVTSFKELHDAVAN